MKVIDIALKDLLRSFRSAFLVAFMFVMPLATVVIFYFAFGGGGDDGGFALPTTDVIVVNLDEASDQFGGFSAGKLLIELLQRGELSELFALTEVDDPARARAAVDSQEAGVALIIPAGFTAAVTGLEEQAAVELYQDPTLSLGPAIVRGVLSQFIDSFAGSKIATTVVDEQLVERGVAVDEAVLQRIAMEYADWTEEQGKSWHGDGSVAPIELQPPAEGAQKTASPIAHMLGLIMSGMMVFYVFFTGAAAAQSILKEEEEGTLSRQFTTPTPRSQILAGKFVAVFATTIVQTVVLIVASSLIFGLDWGAPVPAALAMLGMVVLGASFGICLNSFLKDTKQAGIVYGGVLNLVGWLGIGRMFVGTVPGTEAFADAARTISLFSPHGWAMRGWEQVMAGGGVGDVLLTVLVMVGLGAALFALGTIRFQRRFA
jgi:ABC-2 type transport system permease protein